jgi:hypothetical protein
MMCWPYLHDLQKASNNQVVESCRVGRITSQDATEPLLALEFNRYVSLWVIRWLHNQLVTKSLMRPLDVVVLDILLAQIIEMVLAELDRTVQTLLLYRL